MKRDTETTELNRVFRSQKAARACLLLALAPLLFGTKLLAQIYVANSGDRAVRVYAENSTGDAAPLRTFGGPTQFVTRNSSPALDLATQELFVSGGSNDNIGVYDLTAMGDPVLPIRLIEGPATGLDFVTGIAVDTVHEEVVVASFQADSIVTFSHTASGDVAPLRTIAGVDTELDFPGHPFIDWTTTRFL